MLIKIFGIIDIIAGIVLFFNSYIDSRAVFLFFGVVLLSKALIGMFQDFASWIDLGCGVAFFFMAFFSIPIWIAAIGGILLLQKGVISFL